MRFVDLPQNVREALATPCSNISEHVYVGNLEAAIDPRVIAEFDIKKIVQVFPEKCALFHSSGVSYHHIPIEDSEDVDLIPYLTDACDFIDNAVDAVHNVLIHCQMGQSRSGAVVVAWMMRAFGLDYKGALQKVTAARACVSPNPRFARDLKTWIEHAL